MVMARLADGTTDIGLVGAEPGGSDLTDEELTALALAAGTDETVEPDAVALDIYSGRSPSLLPLWYMPPVIATRARGWRRPTVFVVIAAFLLIDALGLCITFGQLVAA
jgi:hypothetical protein